MGKLEAFIKFDTVAYVYRYPYEHVIGIPYYFVDHVSLHMLLKCGEVTVGTFRSCHAPFPLSVHTI